MKFNQIQKLKFDHRIWSNVKFPRLEFEFEIRIQNIKFEKTKFEWIRTNSSEHMDQGE